MVHRYTHKILQHVSHDDYQPQQVRQLAEALGVPQADHEEFRKAAEKLIEEGHVVVGSRDTIALPPIGREITGKFKLHERGFGFVIPDTANRHGDLFVPPGKSGGALTGDRVRAEVLHDRKGKEGGVTGRIIDIIQRGNTTFVGTLDKRGQLYVVYPDGRTLNDPIIVRDVSAKNAKPGQKVVVELTVFPEGNQTAEGVITEVLGIPGAPDVETLGVIRAFGLSEAFPDDALNEARDATRDYNEHLDEYLQDRLDLRDEFIVTIDPPDAKDFDDAISISRQGDTWELGVHIADVATFVRSDAPLDLEARNRGNSVYLPRKVIPMLPEVLSNGICSLQPGVARLCKSAFIGYDARGTPMHTRFANTVIRSAFRMTYLEAQGLIDGKPDEAKKHQVAEAAYTDQLVQTLRLMDKLSKIIRERRLREGMISLDLPEVELEFDEQGHVIDAHPEDGAYTHKLIEAFMVEANEAVARLFHELDVPVIRRIHPDPGAHDTAELRRFARVAGYNIPDKPTRKELQTLLDATRGKPAARAIHLAVLKTLTKAEYSPQIIGHFALASEHYLHFTSPIRRYPDLTAHRALESLFDAAGNNTQLPRSDKARKQIGGKLRDDPRCPPEPALFEIARHCSGTERKAEAAEHELRDLLVMQLLAEKHLGDEFPGTVTGVTSFGVFVQIDKYVIEGLIRKTELPGAPAERWALNEHTGTMVAQRSGRGIAIGDTLRVRINAVDLSRRQMNLQIVEGPGTQKRPGKLPKTPPQRFEKNNRGPRMKSQRMAGNRGKSQSNRRGRR